MSNEEKIIERIIADAQEEKNKILEEAKASAEDIIKAADEEAKKAMLSAKEEALTEAQKATSKVISGAAMEAKTAILSAKQECLAEALKQAKSRLYSLQPKEYEEIISSMLEKAEKGEILLSAKDNKVLGATLSAKGYEVSQETREIEGGFVVKNGDVEYNYSFEAIMMVEKEEIEQVAAGILFR